MGDADFFLELLPGARDRDGLPESVRQWKCRFESGEPFGTSPVSVIYGPSGCGKSSLIRAGLLPRLAAAIQTIYIEAAADETEFRLRKRLLATYPDLPEDADLVELLSRVRRGQGPPADRKLLIVIDQLEQWLHGKGEPERRPLVRALRQCDGRRLVCLLLVRDDFWVALSRLMAELEIDLVQGRNAALVDLFDLQHARRVLAEFGRAYGQLPDDLHRLDGAQRTFLQQAVRGLAQQDKVVPVRLALLAEMVKHRPWTPATLRNVGGAEGVGVAFLEDTFGTSSPNAQYRMHARAARAVLEALLPESGSEIKGRVRAYPELLDISGYGSRPRVFRELMRILDAETRLLTPTDPERSDDNPSIASPAPRYYQLTHDYLVPSLRAWLTRHQKATPSGRAELCLAERSAMWSARPERRQLPSLREWLVIRLLTRTDQWTPSQQRMMRKARRYHGMTTGIFLALAAFFLLTGLELTSLTSSLLMQVRARSAAFWVAIGQEQVVWPLLKHTPDPTLRTRVIHGLNPAVIGTEGLLDEQARQDDVSARRAMLLAAGETFNAADRRMSSLLTLRGSIVEQLSNVYRDDPDPGVHAATRWLLQRFEQQDVLDHLDPQLSAASPAPERQWYVTAQGHTMMILPGPATFPMGSHETEAGHQEDEVLHQQRIARSFSISSTEVSVEQFQRFIRDHVELAASFHDVPRSAPTAPQLSVTWYEAAGYCNWLSQQEGISPDQWCYQPNAEGRYAAGMRVVDNHIRRSGYRLPDEAEWEYACRAGATTSRFFGADAAYLPYYAVSGAESAD
ncbi:MAG: SUMF1/EgtB/PvdO family nonheme iron enzyme, partial [Planctomycetes bacterium]|nr:SUMF1/EgtB/PvdO family nonheme iron enzyme [Planctomycetota bacterium]